MFIQKNKVDSDHHPSCESCTSEIGLDTCKTCSNTYCDYCMSDDNVCIDCNPVDETPKTKRDVFDAYKKHTQYR